MKNTYILVLLIFSSLVFSCNNSPDPSIAPDPEDNGNGEDGNTEEEYNVKIDLSKTYQTIESFSASDCWAPNYIGEFWNEKEKEGIAKLLFSKDIDDGQPQGIGLSGWRFNLGGGTANQGEASGIEDKSRRAESFMSPTTGELDWSKQKGQQFFLEQAKHYGCEQLVMFSNTPPVYLTKNKKGYSNSGAFCNIEKSKLPDFTNYIAKVLSYFKFEKGIDFELISPVNEPQYEWEGGQEGSGWKNSEIKDLVVELNKSLVAHDLNTKIMLSEAGDWTYLYKGNNDQSNQINNFFSANSSNYVGDLSHVAPIIAGHSYWTDESWNPMIQVRKTLNESASQKDLKVYQTEWSMLGDKYGAHPDEFVGFDKASYLDIALYMSKVIHCDLTYANVSSWSYWTSMDVERWDHKNRFLLIKIEPAGGPYGDIAESGTYEAMKTLWVLGNYSRFIRPNYKRVDLQMKNYSSKIFGNAFLSPDKNEIVAVYTNTSKLNYTVNFDTSNFKVKSIKLYTTNEISNMRESEITELNSPIIIQPQSVVTVVYKLK